ncbi:TPA: DUF551 domain-containing protein [Salmonella enterica]
MTTITREQQKQILIDTDNHVISRDNTSPYSENLRELARIALASLYAEPVAWTSEGALAEVYCGETGVIGPKYIVGDVPPYRHAQPAPVVPEEMPKGLAGQIVSLLAHNIGDKFLAQKIWNACRAAMLQGAEPVSNHDELAPYYLQGQKDGLEWAAQLAEANHPYTGDWLYDDPLDLAKAIRKGPDMPEFAGSSPVIPNGYNAALLKVNKNASTALPNNASLSTNSPVIPCGWISRSERMPEQGAYISAVSRHGEYVAGQVIDDWLDLHDGTSFGLDEVYLWMMLPPLPASPQQ